MELSVFLLFKVWNIMLAIILFSSLSVYYTHILWNVSGISATY